jgi:hypothetical protein
MNLKERADLVDTVGSALSRGEHTLTVLPDLIRQLLEEEAWREFETKMGKHVTYERFEDFVTMPPLAGLGVSVSLVERIVKDDPETLTLLYKALKWPIGKHHHDNIMMMNQGTSVSYALRRLEQERPDLLQKVKSRDLSPHKAMREAGFRTSRISVNLDDPQSAAKTLLTHASPAFLEELKRMLAEA